MGSQLGIEGGASWMCSAHLLMVRPRAGRCDSEGRGSAASLQSALLVD
jgi:hypothetical protein